MSITDVELAGSLPYWDVWWMWPN